MITLPANYVALGFDVLLVAFMVTTAVLVFLRRQLVQREPLLRWPPGLMTGGRSQRCLGSRWPRRPASRRVSIGAAAIVGVTLAVEDHDVARSQRVRTPWNTATAATTGTACRRYRSCLKSDSRCEEIIESIGGIPLGQPGAPRDVGDLVAFLVSDRASYLTGAEYLIDGGSTRLSEPRSPGLVSERRGSVVPRCPFVYRRRQPIRVVFSSLDE